jgi:beta-1,2-mannobiose phosphorylase / 1,2-beta-oligomannan phosphorylase
MHGYRLTRLGVVMRAEPGSSFEAEGVLNPASGWTADGRLWLLPRIVAEGNVSRVGLAEVVVEAGVPVGVRRAGVVLAPDTGWERGRDHRGVEDPRVTWIPALRLHVMTYVAFGPLGPRTALAVSEDLRHWRRLGPLHFAYQPDLDTDLNLFMNKDTVFFPEPVTAPDGRPAYALLHRPMWDLGPVTGGADVHLPAGLDDPRPGIWISYAPAAAVHADVRNLTRVEGHRLVALPEHDYEQLKIGAGPPPVRVPEGWLLIHHGASGRMADGWHPQRDMVYAAGAMLLDADDPGRVVSRTPKPLLEPLLGEELHGTVPNVVFPTATEEIDGQRFVFYGMADSSIGVARLDSAP